MGLRMPLSLQPWRAAGSVGPIADTEVRIALCVEARGGNVFVFLPPFDRPEDYLALLEVIEATASALGLPVVLEGYRPLTTPRSRTSRSLRTQALSRSISAHQAAGPNSRKRPTGSTLQPKNAALARRNSWWTGAMSAREAETTSFWAGPVPRTAPCCEGRTC